MNYIIISPHFPEHYRLFAIALANKGVNVFGIADVDDHELPYDLREKLSGYYKVHNMENYNEVYKAVAFFAFNFGRIHKIDSFNEHWLEFEAGLRTDFNIPGIKSDEMAHMKQKSLMKKKFIKAGVKVARGRVIDNLPDAIKFVNEVGYPIIAKPDKGVGAWNTYKIHNGDELERFFEYKPSVDYIFEEFIKGQIFSFDGLVDQNGKPVFYTSHAYAKGVMEVVNNDDDIYYYSLREVPEDLKEAGFKIIKEFKLKERFFHFEFFRLENGDLVALEVNMRPPGGYTTDMFNFANDFDIYAEWANIITENKISKQPSKRYHVLYVCRKYNISYLYPNDYIFNNYSNNIVMHSKMSGVFRGALGDEGFILKDENLDRLFEIANEIQKRG